MGKMSVLIPSRNEKYLTKTIEDIFSKARGELEIVAILDGGDWPEGWAETVAKYSNLHTIRHNESKGMRPAINAGAASAISRGAKYLCKFDAHVMVDEGFDVKLTSEFEKNWIVVPRRKRLNPVTWELTDTNKTDIDYHYLSFPDDPKDFGGPGLNGKVWEARARERKDIKLDSEMSSQGSGWAIHAAYFTELELMDTESYGPFWNEAQEFGLKCWLSGGQLMVNKKTWYAHWHKGKAGRGYKLNEDWLKQGATFTKKWLFNEAWAKQTLPFKTLIERFWPVPSWPENWEELVYGKKRNGRTVQGVGNLDGNDVRGLSSGSTVPASLVIHNAYYGIGDSPDKCIDVTEVLQRKVVNNSLDICVTNADLEVGNPFRGQKKKLRVRYSYDGGDQAVVIKEERDWLIIGQSARYVKMHGGSAAGKLDLPEMQGEVSYVKASNTTLTPEQVKMDYDEFASKYQGSFQAVNLAAQPKSAPALNDLLIRKFNIPSHRLRGPMPIEVPTFHRDDLAKLFAELGFNKGCEVGVAEGKYSEVLMQANPNLELLLVDPWHHYSGNPQNKSKEKNEFAWSETLRRMKPYKDKVTLIPKLSMDAVRDVPDNSLDFCYIDGHHGFDYVMQDLIEWSKRVRSGGLVCGDDLIHLDEKRWGAGPIEAVTACVKAHRIPVWFICNAHRSVDYFWVKP